MCQEPSHVAPAEYSWRAIPCKVHCSSPAGVRKCMNDTVRGTFGPRMGTIDTQLKLCKSPPTHSCHLFFKLEPWVQEVSHIVHQVYLGHCHCIQNQRWKVLGTRGSLSFAWPLNWSLLWPIQAPIFSKHWDRTSKASLKWLWIRYKAGYHQHIDVTPNHWMTSPVVLCRCFEFWAWVTPQRRDNNLSLLFLLLLIIY